MAAGVGGLQTALILIGFIVRFQPNFNNNIEVYDVRLENLGFYACQLDIKESKFDYTIQKLCSGVLDTSNQNGRPEKIITGNRKIANPSTYCLILSILLSGDIHINPDAIKYPCTLYPKLVRSNQMAIQCDFCDNWTHLKCTKITVSEYTKLGESNETYFCKTCTDRLPKFTDSYFGETSFRSNDNVFNLTGSSCSSTHDDNNETYDIFNELTEQRKKHLPVRI
jgi:hypothetical protein